MTLSIWLSFIAVAFLQAITPGPAVTLLVSTGMQSGRNAALALVPGIFLGDMALIIFVFLMATALVQISSDFMQVIKFAGGFYLIYLGARNILFYNNNSVQQEHIIQKNFQKGFLTSVLNPKGILFFSTLLPQFIQDGGDYATQFLTLGFTFLLVGISTDISYALASSYSAHLLTSAARKGLIWVAGLSLVITGVTVLLSFVTV
jgi:homoserine/homoserine lactone efflux protein